MNVKKIILSSAIAMGALTGFAQAAGEVVEYDFKPTLYIQGQIGGQETVGEGSFGSLLSPNVQLGVGYQWNPLFGARLSVNGWQSRAAMNGYKWHWSYISPMVDVTFNLTNAFGGYNPERFYDVNLIAGVGANAHFRNQRANRLNNDGPTEYQAVDGVIQYDEAGAPIIEKEEGPLYKALGNCWNHGHWSLVGRIGAAVDFRVTENLKVGLELTLNATDDKYNSKVGSNCDFYWNGLVGVKYTFGKSYEKRVVPVVAPVKEVIRETIYRDTVIVQQPVAAVTNFVDEVVEAQTFERNVFFKINQAIIRPQEMVKVEEIANYMKNHPGSRVHITGYADKGTGTLAINLRLARERANVVVNTLINKFGIAGDRITSSSMTDTLFQPFEIPEQNRVAICVVE